LLVSAPAWALSGDAPASGNGGNIFTAPKSKLEQNREEAARRAEAARKKTEELNKEWRKRQKKEAKAKARAKAKAAKEAAKKKKRAAHEK
jgi:hypothetical protein